MSLEDEIRRRFQQKQQDEDRKAREKAEGRIQWEIHQVQESRRVAEEAQAKKRELNLQLEAKLQKLQVDQNLAELNRAFWEGKCRIVHDFNEPDSPTASLVYDYEDAVFVQTGSHFVQGDGDFGSGGGLVPDGYYKVGNSSVAVAIFNLTTNNRASLSRSSDRDSHFSDDVTPNSVRELFINYGVNLLEDRQHRPYWEDNISGYDKQGRWNIKQEIPFHKRFFR